MKNKPKDMATLEWLLPSLNQQISQVAEEWQLGSDNQNPQQTIRHYHEIIDALTIADMPLLVELATKLSLLVESSVRVSLTNKNARTGLLSHQLLQHELIEYVQTGSYHTELLNDTTNELTRILSDISATTKDSFITDDTIINDKANYNIGINNDIDVTNDTTYDIEGNLSGNQYQQLLFVWRQQVEQLLTINDNQQPILEVLEKVSHYLEKTAHNTDQERLWHLSQLWLRNLAHNRAPLPEDYTSLLAQLEQVIESIKQQAHSSYQNTTLSEDHIKALIQVVYAELLALSEIDEQVQLIVDRSAPDDAFDVLSHTLAELETVIFNLDHPHTVASLLHRVSTRLERRGHSAYATQASTIAQDTERSLASETGFEHQEQIEQQLQELYSDIYRTLDDNQATESQTKDTAPETETETETLIKTEEDIASNLVIDDFDLDDITSSSMVDNNSTADTDFTAIKALDIDNIEDNDFDIESFNIESFDVEDQMSYEELDSEKELESKTDSKTESIDIDDDTHNAFVEKSKEVISDLQDFLPIWQQDPQDLTALTEIRRGFYVLKSLSLMVEALSISEMASSIESLLNHLLESAEQVQDDVVTLVTQAIAQLPKMVADFDGHHSPSIDATAIASDSSALLNNSLSNPDSSMAHTDDIESNGNLSDDDDINDKTNLENTDLEAADSKNTEKEGSLFASDLPAVLLPFVRDTQQLPVDAHDADPDIKEIFIEEAEEVLTEISPLYEDWQHAPDNLTVLQDIRRGFHTLKGSGRMVGANYTAELAWSIENMLNRILEGSITASAPIKTLIADVLAAYPTMMTVFASDTHDYPATVPLWIACANAYSEQLGDEFSYTVIKSEQDFSESEPIVSTTTADKGADSMLQTIHSINEVMAEAPVVIPPQSEEEQEFGKIFIEEAEELLQDIVDFVTLHKDDTEVDVSDDIVRAFHTLRAASGSSALIAISDVSAAIEKSLEQLQQQDTPMSAQHIIALTQSVTLIDGYLGNYKQSIKQQALTVEQIQSQQDLVSLQAMLEESDDTTIVPDNQLSVAELLEDDIDSLLDAEWQLTEMLGESDIEQTKAYIIKQRVQIASLRHKTQESQKFSTLLSALDHAYNYLSTHPQKAYDSDIQSILLDGHAQLVDLFDALAASMSLKVDTQVLENLNNLIDDSSDEGDSHSVDNSSSQMPTIDTETTSIAPVKSRRDPETRSEAIDTDAELLEIFLEEAQELDSAIAQAFTKWRADINDFGALKELQRYLHTIKGGAQMAEIKSIAALTHEVESIYESFIEGRIAPTAQWVDVMQRVQDTLSLQITHTVNHNESFFAASLIAQLEEFVRNKLLPEQVELILPVPAPTTIATKPHTDIQSTSEEQMSLDDIINSSWPNGSPDSDILAVFLEEAEEITNRDKDLLAFMNDADAADAVQALQRDLHTLKGGARMVAASGIADLAHEMETVYEYLATKRRPTTDIIVALLVACHDWLADATSILEQRVNPAVPTALINALQQFIKDPARLVSVPDESLEEQRRSLLAAHAILPSDSQLQSQSPTKTILQTATPSKQILETLTQDSDQLQALDANYDISTRIITHDISTMPAMSGQFAQQEQRTDSNEMIRISGGLIEHMINLSGESAINRARIDMGMSSLTSSIEEMGTTVQRLADQLRRMEIELEAQILSQIDEELIGHEGFDPLEMDQYSSLNQLSKSLTESASDLIDINSTLLEKTRDSESLLLQLSRTQTELQDGLMNSRMVPFTRLKPRLERTVRQTANQLDKKVELTIKNAEGEIDRTILERITSPLEHMLRNAVDHGVEDTKTRLNAGKSSQGNISLEVLREGSEIVIMLTDDGGGIDVESVRKKAVSQGLIEESDTSLTDSDIMQYIFNAGITTTQKVTQISGRGVGMDVVISEIRQLGGSVSVTSEAGVGSRFTIRVPLTVAISDALVVRAADRYYAIPLVQIERVVRVNPEKLQDHYQSGATTLQIDDVDYRVRYLNEILSGNQLNDLIVSTNVSLPLIIIKNSSGQNIALQVDQIAGSRIEVVVKPLGRQLSHIQGISAATIMGDGSVMLILDPIALMRNASMLEPIVPLTKQGAKQSSAQPHVLIVDDSVTVRKVTSRFLERQEYTVTLAKDGVDAVEILQETLPDLILLDIEMPRMDGFEVAIQIRNSKRLQHIPIIMITSRTGEKHRARALEIGVDDYMGKPFQENELLDNIQRLLATNNSLTYEG